MIVHLTPSIFNEYSDVDLELIDLSFPDLDLILKQGTDVVVGKPYPNKCISVVRRKKGNKALNGILVEVPNVIESFSLITRWLVDAKRVLTHIVNYNLIDSEYDFATQDPVLRFEDVIPCHINARYSRMEILFNKKETSKKGNSFDYYQDNMLVSRVENCPLSSIKETDLYGKHNLHLDRMPNIDEVFQATARFGV